MSNALTLTNVTKSYKDFKLDNVTFNLPEGSIMGFIGENGAGKTTTINLILDLIKRDSGEISVLGAGTGELLKEKEHIGVVVDECCFPEELSAKHINVIMKKIFKTWDEAKFRDYVKRFDLPEKKVVREYSKGMKMKLSFAAALSHDSRLLILDEATSGLDPIVRDEILELLMEFTTDKTHSVLMSSHIISDIEKICDVITFIHKGKIVFTSGKDELLENYRMIRCTGDELKAIGSADLVGVQTNKFGTEALVRNVPNLPGQVEKATIEDIMLFHVKESESR